MSFLGNSGVAPHCIPCDKYFKTRKQKQEHDSIAHDRFQSTDIQRGTWVDYNEENNQDYFVCFIHAKKLNEDFVCPVRGCTTSIIGRKSVYLQELRNKTPDI